ncbi:cysteine desulfurase family protein [Proteinivorax tanatarense]|uniref:Cysteine desulfurase family protein n=1 Tax=Proteinivorax tanatarense TaxID=1260629 RepID=A0AAU7VIC1_9FIRM
MMEEVYLDNCSTTKIDDDILKVYSEYQKEVFANPSSVHSLGVKAEKIMAKGKGILLDTLNVEREYDIIFGSGGTECNNLAILGTLNFYQKRGKKIVTTPIEHASVLERFKELKKQGYVVEYVNVDNKGLVDLDDLRQKVDQKTVLISIMAVNNEIGTVQPLRKIGSMVKEVNPKCVFHVDGVQGYGKIDINLNECNIDLFSISSHKFHGPKGVGALFVKEKVGLTPLLYGGGQQKGLRPGTENVPGCYAMAIAADKMYKNQKDYVDKIIQLKEKLKVGIKERVAKSIIVTPDNSAPHILNVAFENFKGEVLVRALEEVNIYVSTGSACSSKAKDSHVLKAINLPKQYRQGAIRFSLSYNTTDKEIEYTIEKTAQIVEDLQLFM